MWQQLQIYSYKLIYHKIRCTELDLKSCSIQPITVTSALLNESSALLRSNYDNLLSVIDRMNDDSLAGLLDSLTANSSISLKYLPDDVKSTASLSRFVKTTIGALVIDVAGKYEATCQLLDLIAVCRLAIVDYMQANHLASHIANGLLVQYSQVLYHLPLLTILTSLAFPSRIYFSNRFRFARLHPVVWRLSLQTRN